MKKAAHNCFNERCTCNGHLNSFIVQSYRLFMPQQSGTSLIMEQLVCPLRGFWQRLGGRQKAEKQGCRVCNHISVPSNNTVTFRRRCDGRAVMDRWSEPIMGQQEWGPSPPQVTGEGSEGVDPWTMRLRLQNLAPPPPKQQSPA